MFLTIKVLHCHPSLNKTEKGSAKKPPEGTDFAKVLTTRIPKDGVVQGDNLRPEALNEMIKYFKRPTKEKEK